MPPPITTTSDVIKEHFRIPIANAGRFIGTLRALVRIECL
jgi:hypothetical protein